jgi:hypothetical protein
VKESVKQVSLSSSTYTNSLHPKMKGKLKGSNVFGSLK